MIQGRFQLIQSQYDAVLAVLEQVPDLKVAICHFGSPWHRSAQDVNEWKNGMTRFANLPNVFTKFSGFAMFDPHWNVETLRPFVEGALDVFGSSRCMVGSNYPVDGLSRPYGDIFHAISELTERLPDRERELIFAGTACRFYKIDKSGFEFKGFSLQVVIPVLDTGMTKEHDLLNKVVWMRS